MRIFIGLCLSAFLVGMVGLNTGCALRVTLTPVDTETITQQTLGNKLWDWAFKTEEAKKS